MIECFKIEEFVIDQLFRPYTPSFLPGDFQGEEYINEQNRIEKKLRKIPEYIIELLEEYPEVKRKAFRRINKFGGIRFYRYLDMNCDVIKYLQSELSKYKVETSEMVRQLLAETGCGMMDCKKALIQTNCDIDKSKELLKEKPQCFII